MGKAAIEVLQAEANPDVLRFKLQARLPKPNKLGSK